MNNTHRKPLIALVALSAALAMPLAFAQEQTEDAAAQSETEQTEQATGSTTQVPTQSTQSADAQGQQGWADIDVDGNGVISKQEAAANAGLSQVFDQADTDMDGNLTAEEYKAFVSKNYDEQK
ncbi:EF-hand domain-containing protein [Pseudoxanthomonas putridarboris]|uniref:EF-hand domain-containing protein n=1 Tax=Pseudoxanthomonas putridarboris TaxID=752605 RepID=A0ABU9IVC1_9GAMM